MGRRQLHDNAQMNAAQFPVLYLPLAWMGVLCTSLSYAVLARARIDRARVLRSLDIRNSYTFAVCLYSVWTFAAALILSSLLRRDGITRAAVGLEGSLSLAGALLAITCAVLGIVFWPILERITRYFGVSLFSMRLADRRLSDRLSVLELVLLTTFGAIAVPALEEFIFRGYVLTALREYTGGTSSATLCTSLIFASIHFGFGGGMIIYAFVLSLILSAVFLLSSNLYPAILAHSLINFWGFVAVPIFFHSKSPAST